MKKLTFSFLICVLVLSKPVIAQDPQAGWPFSYPGDAFTGNALLDLRYLNENTAGENGFIKLSPDSNSFITGNGKPIRFWAIGGGEFTKDLSTDTAIEKFARFLAKMGVNMIRFHGAVHPTSATADLTQANSTEVNAIWRMVALMKKYGIYSVISPYWAGHITTVPSNWGIEGYSGTTNQPWEVMYFDDKLKNAYKEWVKTLYTVTNPYTGIALKDDPAVALIQIKNEDGVFWWTISSVQPALLAKIEKKYYTWLISKYTTIANAKAAWYNTSISTDNPGEQRMSLYHIWDITQTGHSAGKEARLSDQIHFLADVQRDFYKEIYDHYRSLGCKQLINGNNWKTADPVRLFDTERWTNAVCEVIAVNRYYDPGHIGENSGWRIDPGHHYEGKSALYQPHKLPINIKQVVKHPTIVSESGWNLPHKYQAEGPFLIAAYESLNGIDGYFWFSPNAQNYNTNPYFDFTSFPGGQKAMHRWTCSIPGQLAMFPANALLFRQGYLAQAEPVVHEERTLESFWKREFPLISEENGKDPNHEYTGTPPPGSSTVLTQDTYLAGPVEVKYEGNPSNNKISQDLGTLVNFTEKKITSVTGQLNWDFGKGICTMDAPAAQGVCGFLKQTGTFKLSDVTITSPNDYAAVNVVSMDGKPLNQSSKVLIQVGTIYRPSGWVETPALFTDNNQTINGFRIDNTGKMPWKAAKTLVSMKIKNGALSSATKLDLAGYPAGSVPFTQNGTEMSLTLPEDAMYVVLQASTGTGEIPTRQNNVRIYPNPATNMLNIDILQGSAGNILFEMRDAAGQKILEKKPEHQGSFSVDLKGISPGIYLACIKGNPGFSACHKVIIY